MPRPLRSTLALLSAAFVTAAFSVSTAHADDPQAAPIASAKKAAPTLEDHLARWQAKPDSIGRGIKLQDAYARAGKSRAITAIFRDKHKERPEDQAIAFLYGRAKGGTSGIKMMREALKANLGRTTGDTSGLLRAWTALAVAEVEAGHGEEAERAARRIAGMRGLAEDWTYLGWIQERLVRAPDRALESYATAVRVKPDHLRARHALALMHADAGRVKEAVALAKGSVEKHPDNADAQVHLGLLLAMAGEKKEAAAAYGKALACAARDADALASIASAYLDLEENDLALKAVNKALAIDPDHVEALGNAGLLAMERGDVSAAAGHLKRAAKLDPKNAHLHYLQGVCAQRAQQYSAAVNHLRKAMSLEPKTVEYVTALALAQSESGAYPAAISMFKRASKMAPEDADLQLQLGIAYLRHRKYKSAGKAFDKAVELAPKDPRPRYYQAIVYGDKLGKARIALEALKAYEALGGKEPSALAWLEELRVATGEK